MCDKKNKNKLEKARDILWKRFAKADPGLSDVHGAFLLIVEAIGWPAEVENYLDRRDAMWSKKKDDLLI